MVKNEKTQKATQITQIKKSGQLKQEEQVKVAAKTAKPKAKK